jgi:hypothetical protein
MSDNAPENSKAQAKADKAYAKASRPWYKKKRFIIPIALVVIAIAASAGGGADDLTSGSNSSSSSSSDDSSGKKTESHAPSVTAEAAAMVKEFQDNELAADAKYKGKWVQVNGVVDKIDTEMFDENKYVLRIGGGTDFEILTVNCNDIPKDVLSSINKGDDVTVVGEFKDGGDAGVELKHCRIA